MEYVDGFRIGDKKAKTLQQYLELQTSQIPIAYRYTFLNQICSAMTYLHSKQRYHRKELTILFKQSEIIFSF